MASMPRFLIREIETSDLEGLYRLSAHLNSVNFPHDRDALDAMINAACRSFGGQTTPADGRYMFALVPATGGAPVGTCMIFGQHGTPSSPHIYFDILQDERYSTTLDRHFSHTTLRLGFAYNGPTEIGALVLDPNMRSAGLGKPLSFVRFVFIAMYRHLFRNEVIAELMPPLEANGRSRLWEHIGRRFTDLTYQEADKLSQTNKEFIISLFPMEMNATLLPDDVRRLIGEVGAPTRGVRHMLENIGFTYADRIDPFDGGPHFHAATDTISVVRNTRPGQVAADALADKMDQAILNERRHVPDVTRALVAVGQARGPTNFRATAAAVQCRADHVLLTETTRALLRIEPGDPVYVSPF